MPFVEANNILYTIRIYYALIGGKSMDEMGLQHLGLKMMRKLGIYVSEIEFNYYLSIFALLIIAKIIE
jgi:hypothetical protein